MAAPIVMSMTREPGSESSSSRSTIASACTPRSTTNHRRNTKQQPDEPCKSRIGSKPEIQTSAQSLIAVAQTGGVIFNYAQRCVT